MSPQVMGIVNVTPDSFFDGGRYLDATAAIDHGFELIEEGADLLDIGGESTRPGALAVSEDEELRRVLPVVEALSPFVRISIDTMKPAVADAAIDCGASLLNDVSNTLAPVAAKAGVGYVVMHMQGTPRDMQRAPRYDDVVTEVFAMLNERANAAREAGIDEVYVDPGIGFGKTLEHNLALLGALPQLVAAGNPVLVGTSRKSFLGRLHQPSAAPLPVEERLEGSLATAVWAAKSGAAMVRVHDVRATVQAMRLLDDRPDRADQRARASTGATTA